MKKVILFLENGYVHIDCQNVSFFTIQKCLDHFNSLERIKGMKVCYVLDNGNIHALTEENKI